MKKIIFILLTITSCQLVFSQAINNRKDVHETTIKAIVEDSRSDIELSYYRYLCPVFFVQTIDQEALVFLVEDNGYVIPVRLQKNDLNAVNRFLARNLQKGDFLTIEGKVERIELNEEKYRGLIDAVIVENDEYEVKVQGSASIHLKGRHMVGTLPKPAYNAQVEGTVVVMIKVDQYGTVMEAIPGAEGTTISDKALWNAARSAALKVHFNQDSKAPTTQTGTITYVFKLK